MSITGKLLYFDKSMTKRSPPISRVKGFNKPHFKLKTIQPGIYRVDMIYKGCFSSYPNIKATSYKQAIKAAWIQHQNSIVTSYWLWEITD